jgi:hypothetical protein
MRPIGFSTGALARGDFRRALALLHAHRVGIVELSALRLEELEPLMAALPGLELERFAFVSIHAPSRFERHLEHRVVEMISTGEASKYPVVVHPDVVFTPSLWRQLGNRLLIENMDKRKPVGRTVQELETLFGLFPDAKFCFDIGHARQVDPTMTEAALLLQTFGERLAEVHISEVNTASRHDPISRNATLAFQRVAKYIPEDTPIILEPLIDEGQSELDVEIQRARQALSVECVVAA